MDNKPRYKISRIGSRIIGYSTYITDTVTGDIIDYEHDDPAIVEQHVKRLNDKHESIIALSKFPG